LVSFYALELKLEDEGPSSFKFIPLFLNSQTVPTYEGKIIDSIKVGKAVIDKVPVAIDKISGIAGKVIDKGEEVAGSV